jgi:diacylglycerol kinase (ATP)
MRFHFLLVVLVLSLGLLFRFDALQMALLGVASAAVIVVEMVNTAVETVVDMITQSYHPLAKLSKDIAAGAVLVTAIAAAAVGMLLFVSKFGESFRLKPVRLDASYEPVLTTLIVLVVLVLVITVILKVLGGKGTMLHGGIVSAHAAIAFTIAMIVINRVGRDGFTAVLVMALALLVAQSRVEGKVHTLQEAVLGGLLGICITAAVYHFQIGGH